MSPLTVHLIQAATRWHDPAGNRDDFEPLMASGAAADVIMLPEMFSTGFSMDSKTLAETMDGPTVLWMRERAESLGSVIAGSLIVDDGGFFNRLIWATPDGGLQYYDKRHLFRMAGEDQYFSPGEERVIVSYQGWRLCLSVCYDLRFPVWLRNRGDYDALVCVANWPAARAAAWQTLLRARAIENQAYCIGLNIVGRDGSGLDYAGGSAVYAPDGEPLVLAGDQACQAEATLDATALTALRQAFPVALDADSFVLEDPHSLPSG